MAMTPVHVNIASDEIEGYSSHLVLPPAGSGLAMSEEIRIHQQWKPGAAKHKITAKVFHRGLGIVLHGHDCGAMIPDLAPAGLVGRLNTYMPMIMAKSSRKVMFAASTVKAEGTAIGGVDAANLPMLTCGEPVSLPFTFTDTSAGNTVLVGFSAEDIDRGWEDISDAICVDVIAFWAGLGPLSIGKIIEAATGWDPAKSLAGAGIGLLRSAARSYASDWKEPISLKGEVGGGMGGGGVELKWTPGTGEFEAGGEVGGFTKKASGGAKRGPDGQWKPTGDLPPDLFD